MSYRFDGRVVVITGAGRGLGRAHARLFAERGAAVVVNDLGGTKEGDGQDVGPATEVVAEIVAAGGTAIADTGNIADEADCHALVERTIAEFGRIDVLVNNAGISRWATFPDADAENLDRTLDVHVRGSWHTTRAAWPHFARQGFGRVLMTNSTGMFGMPDNIAYATAKGALIGMMRSLSLAGAPHGITVNSVAPNAMTRPGTSTKPNSISSSMAASMVDDMRTELVSPMLAYLAHESCDVTGRIFLAGARRFSSMPIGVTDGYLHDGPDDPTVEDVAANWQKIQDEGDPYMPASAAEWAARYLEHVRR